MRSRGFKRALGSIVAASAAVVGTGCHDSGDGVGSTGRFFRLRYR